jgi:aspartate carbamoyltransferase regulatory subunit
METEREQKAKELRQVAEEKSIYEELKNKPNIIVILAAIIVAGAVYLLVTERGGEIVKVENRDLKTDEINRIAVIAPGATINRIRDFKVVEKKQVALPNEIIGIIKCSNPACISNKEREPLKSFFYVSSREPLTLSCKYCEREVSASLIEVHSIPETDSAKRNQDPSLYILLLCPECHVSYSPV